MVNILGIAGSLRSRFLQRDLDKLPDSRNGLMGFLKNCSKNRWANSELSMMTALWGARREGTAINAITLSKYHRNGDFNGNKAALVQLVKEADGIFISSPVYFGANSFLIQNFIELLNSDPAFQSGLTGKIYAGLAVGAKRNGGQETTLIYQMADMLNLGFLGVGNNSTTTCQYGGTVVAGNASAMLEDRLGIETCIGAGSRIARTARIYATGKSERRRSPPRFQFLILQDRHRMTETLIHPLINLLTERGIPSGAYRVYDYALQPCKACDHCPDQKAADGGYRCRIDTPEDEFKLLHKLLVETDVIVPTIYSPEDRTGLTSVYQRFFERTRYLRRSDYMLSNRVIIPLVFCEIGRNEHLDLRLISSFIRHNTIVHKPMNGTTHNGQLINPEKFMKDWETAIQTSVYLAAGRCHMEKSAEKPKYIPFGY